VARRRRDYAAEHRRRNEAARERGFSSYAQQRRAPRRLTRPGDFALLPEAARESRTDALRAIGLSRKQQTSVEEAVAEVGISMRTVRFWAPEALEPQRRGRTLPTRGDRLTRLRPIVLEDESELVFLTVRGSRAADRGDHIFDVQWRFITGHADDAELATIRGLRINGRVVESNPARLVLMAGAGVIDVPEAYREIVG